MAKCLNDFFPIFERLTKNPEDYLRYDDNSAFVAVISLV
jgi:hypothetical protein